MIRMRVSGTLSVFSATAARLVPGIRGRGSGNVGSAILRFPCYVFQWCQALGCPGRSTRRRDGLPWIWSSRAELTGQVSILRRPGRGEISLTSVAVFGQATASPLIDHGGYARVVTWRGRRASPPEFMVGGLTNLVTLNQLGRDRLLAGLG